MIQDKIHSLPFSLTEQTSIHFRKDFVKLLEEDSSNTHSIQKYPDPQTSNENPSKNNYINNENDRLDKNQVPKRKFFTKNEDHLLTLAAIKYKQEKWNCIAKCVPGKTPKQCRDRWVNYLQPSLNFEPWTDKEDELLLSLVKKHGTHWSKMKSNFPNRSTNSLKNRFYRIDKYQQKDSSKEKIANIKLSGNNNNQIKKDLQVTFNNNNNNYYPFRNINAKEDRHIMNNSNFDHYQSFFNEQPKQENQSCFILSKIDNKNKSHSEISKDNYESCTKQNILNNVIEIKNNFHPNIFSLEENELITFTPEELDW